MIILFVFGSILTGARQRIVSQFNVVRTSLIDNETTPLQVGNGDFAFNVDNTGMQVRLPYCPHLHVLI
jgi:hypothetical protein